MPPSKPKAAKQEPTDEEKTLAVIASKKWADYNARFKPIENTLNEELDNLGNEEERQRLAGINIAGVEQGLGLPDARQIVSGGSANLTGILGREEVRRTGRAAGEESANEVARDRAQAGLKNIVARGRSQEGEAIGGLKTQANIANIEQVSKAQQKLREQSALSSALGSVAGIGLDYALNRGGGLQGPGAPGASGLPTVPKYDNTLDLTGT